MLLVFLYLEDAILLVAQELVTFTALKKSANYDEQREKNTRENYGEACANTSSDATQHADSAMHAEEFPCIFSRGSEDDRGVGGWEDVA